MTSLKRHLAAHRCRLLDPVDLEAGLGLGPLVLMVPLRTLPWLLGVTGSEDGMMELTKK